MRHCPSPGFRPVNFLMSCLPDLLYGSSARTLRSLSRTRKSLALRRVMLRASRSKADVVSVRWVGDMNEETPALLPVPALQLFEECRCGAHLALAVALVALADLF